MNEWTKLKGGDELIEIVNVLVLFREYFWVVFAQNPIGDCWIYKFEWLFMYNLGALGVYPCAELISNFKNAIQTTKNHYFVKI
jgi:hypothetical protein